MAAAYIAANYGIEGGSLRPSVLDRASYGGLIQDSSALRAVVHPSSGRLHWDAVGGFLPVAENHWSGLTPGPHPNHWSEEEGWPLPSPLSPPRGARRPPRRTERSEPPPHSPPRRMGPGSSRRSSRRSWRRSSRPATATSRGGCRAGGAASWARSRPRTTSS